MAILNMTDQLTALELAKRANNPEAFNIIELLRMTNEMLIDVPAYPANNGMINVTLQRNIGPMGQHRIYNQGVGKVATVTSPVHDRIAILAAYSDVDKNMADNSGNVNAVRNSEAIPIVKGMGLTQAETIIYGDDSRPEEFAGLMSRRNSLSDPNVVDAASAGGSGTAYTSIYLVAVGRELFHLIYPEKSGYGIGVMRADRGTIDVKDARDATKEYPVYREYFEAMYGITVRAPDAVKRIVNIRNDITPSALLDVILDTRYRLPPGASTYAMYGNVDILIKLDKAARDKDNVAFTKDDPWGQPITHVRDIRVRRMDVILSTESAVA
jgi:hypothetical protein